jgi:hypothetical protein
MLDSTREEEPNVPDKAPQNGEHRAELRIDDKVLEVPVIVGTENEKAIDIGKLRAQTGYLPGRGAGDPALPRHSHR